MNHPPTLKKQLEFLKSQCRYSVKGKPDIYTFGAFKDGLTAQEVNDYLRIRTNSMNISKVFKKYIHVSGCNTCISIMVNSYPIVLHYRYDVERHADLAINGTETHWD
jgi:sarcosine oxidase delta subunit